MSGNGPSLEKLWKHRWDEAKRKLELAAIRVKQIELQTRSGDDYRQALEAEILAAAEYTRVLRIYTDLVIYGKNPEKMREQAATVGRDLELG